MQRSTGMDRGTSCRVGDLEVGEEGDTDVRIRHGSEVGAEEAEWGPFGWYSYCLREAGGVHLRCSVQLQERFHHH